MEEHFRQDCAEMRQRIDEHLGNARSPTSAFRSGLIDPNLEAPPATARSGSSAFAQTSSAVPRKPLALAWHKRPHLPALLLLALGIGVWAGRSKLEHLSARGEAKDPGISQAQFVAAAQSPESITPTPAIGQVTISLQTKPQAAALLLDGRRISNPYRAAHGKDALQHHLTVTLPGYQSIEQELTFTADIAQTFELLPQTLARRGKPEHEGATTSASASKSSPASAPSLVQPGEDLRGSNLRSSARTLDETDPYKR
jgi:hypothetical protein